MNDLTIADGCERLLVDNRLDTLDRLFECEPDEILDKPGLSSWRERLRLTVRLDAEETVLYLKRYTDPPPAARRALRRSDTGARSLAGLEWTRMCQLAANDIPCVQPVAFGERLSRRRERQSAILAKAVPGQSLENWTKDWSCTDRRTIRAAATAAADIVARFHRCGYIHRDLYLSHLFFDPSAGNDAPIRLIDLQRVLHRPRFFRRWVVKDLASLNFSAPVGLCSHADRLRWLKRYLGVPKLDRAAKRLAYAVIGKTRRIARHDQRRRDRLALSTGVAS